MIVIAQWKIIDALPYIFSQHINIFRNLGTLWKVLWVIWTSCDGQSRFMDLWQWLCHPVPETVHSILSSGDNFAVLFILSSIDMCYKLNATIILELCNNVHLCKPHIRLIFLTFLDIPSQFTCLRTMDYWLSRTQITHYKY